MSRELWILRHAKSDWGAGCVHDVERPLAKRGLKAAPKMGQWMSGQGLRPDYILSSPAQRARQTIELVCDALGLDQQVIQWDERLYPGEREVLLGVLADCPPKAKTVLLVGHNPGLEELLEYLGGSTVAVPPDGKLLPTATLARLALPKDWSRLRAGDGRLLAITRPKELKA